MIFIGASLGGLRAVTTLLKGIPPLFPVPMAIVLHRGKDVEGALCDLLGHGSNLPVSEPHDKEPILPSRVYLAPSDYHLLVEKEHFCLSVDDPVRYARPSIDVLFESAADAFGPEAIAIILSGANCDGTSGARKIKEAGGRVIVQDPATAEAPQMPQAVLSQFHPDYILPLDRMAPLLVELTALSS